MTPLQIFIGYDRAEPVAFHVLAASILRRLSRPIAITPLVRTALTSVYTRERAPNEATEFSLTRFLVPHLSQYQGFSLFLDCDMLAQVDVGDVLLHALADPGKAVYVCQHDYVPKDLTKFDGHEQTRYPKKNWSSVCLFDNAKCTALTPAYVQTASGLALHRFQWLESDDQIGSLPLAWNWLVSEYPANPTAKILHFTNGVPAYPAYAGCDQADLWWNEYAALRAPLQPEASFTDETTVALQAVVCEGCDGKLALSTCARCQGTGCVTLPVLKGAA